MNYQSNSDVNLPVDVIMSGSSRKKTVLVTGYVKLILNEEKLSKNRKIPGGWLT